MHVRGFVYDLLPQAGPVGSEDWQAGQEATSLPPGQRLLSLSSSWAVAAAATAALLF